jgi:hypothetical protein
MKPLPNETTRNLNPRIKLLGLLLLFSISASCILHSQSIVQSSAMDLLWSHDHDGNWYDNNNDDNESVEIGGGLRGILQREREGAFAEPNNNTIKNMNYVTSNWTSTWINSIPSSHHASPHILYVHVGKTGGTTLEEGIPIPTGKVITTLLCTVQLTAAKLPLHNARQFCFHHIDQNQPTDQLARHILAHKHLQYPQLPNLLDFAMEHIDTILITTRNPIDRIVSSFNFQRNTLVHNYTKRANSSEEKERIQSSLYKFSGVGVKESFYNCFPDVRYMAEELAHFFHLNDTHSRSITLPTTSSNTSIVYNNMTCGQLANDLLSPRQYGGLSHYTSNYRWYKQLTIDKRPEVPILIVRTEYLWQDATNIEVALGGNASNFLKSHHTMSYGSESYAVKAKLETDLQRKAVCCAIYDDLQAYQDIILSALNLDEHEKMEMMGLVYRDCSVDQDAYEGDILYGIQFWEKWVASNCNGRG